MSIVFFFGIITLTLAQVTPQANTPTSVCEFPLNNQKSINKQYDPTKLTCFDCTESSGVKTLAPKLIGDNIEICTTTTCNGLLCDRNFTCHPPHKITQRVMGLCTQKSRITELNTIPAQSAVQNQIPLIIGFAIGGVMLAVVIGGVFLGRARGSSTHEESDIMTTPVSMSYSEWMSNYSMGGARGSKGSNMRVEETVDQSVKRDRGAVQVYNIVYGGTQHSPTDENVFGPVVIEVDDTASLDQQTLPFSSSTENLYDYNINNTNGQLDEYVTYEHETTQFASDVYLNNEDYEETQHNLIDRTYFDHDPEQFVYSMDNGVFITDRVNAPIQIRLDENNFVTDTKDSRTVSEIGVFDNNALMSLKHVNSDKNSKIRKRDSNSWSEDSWTDVQMSEDGDREQNDMLVALPVSPDGRLINTANLKHVYADVHRNMTLSMEDMVVCPQNSNSELEKLKPKVSLSKETNNNLSVKFKSQGDVTDDVMMQQLSISNEKVKRSLSVMTKSKSVTIRKEWARKSVRRPSSCGSGEYAIPYGSIQWTN